MSEKQLNSFQGGMNLDISDMLMSNQIARFNQNVRIINLDGSNYLISNLSGNEVNFQLSSGFKPVALQEYRSILYIISWNQSTGHIECGSYPSPGDTQNVYRPFGNLIGGPTVGDVTDAFRVPISSWELANTFPIIQKLEIQQEYDGSVNLLFTIRGKKPRIVNSKFQVESTDSGLVLSEVTDRVGNVNSNIYSLSSIDKETATIIYSPKILGLALNGITSGGILKPGNYVYVFQYMTEDFNVTNVVAQSSICQIAFGDTVNSRRGGGSTEQTSLRTILNLTNIDTDFKYLKVFCQYSSGVDSLEQQYLEFTTPVQITGESMQFIHTGYEDLAEVSADTVNIDYGLIEGADVSTQIGGYYLLGGIKQRSFDFQPFKEAAAAAVITFSEKQLAFQTLPGYANPENVYNYMGYFGREAYPFAMVFIMLDGSLSPAFPMKGVDFDSTAYGNPSASYEVVTTPEIEAGGWYKGIVRFPWTNHYPTYDKASNTLRIKHLKVNLSAISEDIRTASAGFFIVRAQRNEDLVTQGIIFPTFKAPTVKADTGFDVDNHGHDGYYHDRGQDEGMDNTNFFKRLPIMDNMLEAYRIKGQFDSSMGTFDFKVLDEELFFPAYLQNRADWTSGQEMHYVIGESRLRHWAFLSSDAILNESEYNSKLNLTNLGVHQLDKVNFKINGEIPIDYSMMARAPGRGAGASVGMLYEFERFLSAYTSKPTSYKLALNMVPVPYPLGSGDGIPSSGDFVSKFIAALYAIGYNPGGGGGTQGSAYYYFRKAYSSFFGLVMDPTDGQLADATKGATNPLAGSESPNVRAGVTIIKNVGNTNNPYIGTYDNLDREVTGAFLINVYRSSVITPYGAQYPTVDNLSYKQVTKRYSWSEVASPNTIVDVFGGDCYISKVYRRLTQNGEVDNLTADKAWNIDLGQVISWYQESKYNAHLRNPFRFDVTESEDRSFYPYQSSGSFTKYRKFRISETSKTSPGYAEITRPKSFFSTSNLAPSIENYFFSRIAHSERHVPNAFRNGYRVFLETNFRDYDSSMGRMTGMFNHRGRLLIIFEQGIAITDINQRIQTGSDAAGAIFVEPSSVLPVNIQYVSREIGCQDHLSFVQTPSAVYGIDKAKSKIWQFRDTLKVISDEGVSSFVFNNVVAPRSGYDLENNEVLFTTNNYTICYREGLERFTSFYSFKPDIYARRNNELYSFLAGTSWKHNQPVYTIYGENKDSIVEFVINQGLPVAKVVDYLNIISNDVPPAEVEIYSYNQDVDVGPVINTSSLNQYAKVVDEVDVITEEPTIAYRDKRFIVQVPVRSVYGNPESTTDEWGIEGRIRDKYIIVRLTYRTELPLELASVISNFRYSSS